MTHPVPGAQWTTGWCWASCGWRSFGSGTSYDPGPRLSSHPASKTPAVKIGSWQEMFRPWAFFAFLKNFIGTNTHQKDLPKAKDVVVRHRWALVGLVEKERHAAHDQKHTQVFGHRVAFPQDGHPQHHHCGDKHELDGTTFLTAKYSILKVQCWPPNGSIRKKNGDKYVTNFSLWSHVNESEFTWDWLARFSQHLKTEYCFRNYVYQLMHISWTLKGLWTDLCGVVDIL